MCDCCTEVTWSIYVGPTFGWLFLPQRWQDAHETVNFFSKIIIELMIRHLILRCNFRVIKNDCSIRSKIVPYITTSFAKKFSIIKVYNIMVSIKSQNLFFLYTTQLNNWITFHHFIVQLFSGAHWKKLNNLQILFLQTANLDDFFVRIKQ